MDAKVAIATPAASAARPKCIPVTSAMKMTTAMFIAGPVARNSAAASGRTVSTTEAERPSFRAYSSIAGSEPVEDWVEKAIA